MDRILLVVDDDEDIARLLGLTLRKHFDEVHVAKDAASADALLRAHRVTHVVCDFYMGPAEPPGVSLVARWRGEHASIRYAALFSGSVLADLDPGPAVDDVYAKPRGFHALVAKLAGAERGATGTR